MELTLEAKKAIIADRLKRLIEDRFKYELNYKFSVEQNQAEAIEKFKQALDGSDMAIEFHKKELAALEA